MPCSPAWLAHTCALPACSAPAGLRCLPWCPWAVARWAAGPAHRHARAAQHRRSSAGAQPAASCRRRRRRSACAPARQRSCLRRCRCRRCSRRHSISSRRSSSHCPSRWPCCSGCWALLLRRRHRRQPLRHPQCSRVPSCSSSSWRRAWIQKRCCGCCCKTLPRRQPLQHRLPEQQHWRCMLPLWPRQPLPQPTLPPQHLCRCRRPQPC